MATAANSVHKLQKTQYVGANGGTGGSGIVVIRYRYKA